MRSVKSALWVMFLCHASVSLAQDCYESSIKSPSPFMGNDGEVFVLTNGTIWEVKYEYEYLYEYYPSVIICPAKSRLIIDDKALKVIRVGGTDSNPGKSTLQSNEASEFIESSIDGDFEGWDGETIVKLMNGQVWQQTDYYYHYYYAYGPRVQVVKVSGKFKMQVEGVDKAVGVSRLK